MARKIEKGDDVLIRGEVIWIDDNGLIRKFRGYQYPITVDPDMIEQVIKPPAPKPRRKPLRDVPE
ncbi:hypothetical protein [Sinorhizobium fredii]|uniref:hypothetical protein n=1 Tax=Rhizobium fredii TaxID=380 RepID=UPI0035187F79